MTRFLQLLAVFLLLLPIGLSASVAQDSNDADKSSLTRFVENQLSAENRQIRLNHIQGALSSDATIGEITVADRQGVWLRIVNAHIVWTRSALLFGRLEIDSLGADKIEVVRKPLPDQGAPAPSSSGFTLPKLPVSVTLKQLNVPEVDFGQGLFGLASRISIAGGLKLADGVLDTKLAIKRLDGPGGSLQLAANYTGDTQKLDLDLKLDEPKNGILANMLNIYGKPAVSFGLKGAGPVTDLALDMTLDADGKRALTGNATIHQTGDGLKVGTNLHGPIADLIAPAFRQFFGGNTALTADALIKNGGGVAVNSLDLTSGAVKLAASAETTKDNFLKTLKLDADVANADGSGVLLPVPGQKTMVKSVKLQVNYGDTGSNRWGGNFEISRLGTSMLGADTVNIDFGGTVDGIDTPENRSLTYKVSGAMSGISTKNPDVRTAIGNRIDLAAKGGWSTGKPVTIEDAAIKANELALTVAGGIKDLVFNGTIGVKAASIAPFAALANRPLAGSLDLSAKGAIQATNGGFDLTFDGSGKGLHTGVAKVDPLIRNEVKITGRLARTKTGFEATDFFVGNDQANFKANGVYAPDNSDFNLDVMLSDLSLVTDRASGRITLTGSVKGNRQAMKLDVDGAIPSGTLAGRKLADAKIGFTGNLIGIDPQKGQPYGNGVNGHLSAAASLSGQAVKLDSDILATPDQQKLDGLKFTAGGTDLTGRIDRNAAGLIDGAIRLDASDISTVAALATLDAKGAANATIDLSRQDDKQHVAVSGKLDGISVGATRVDAADIKATIDDLFGVPKVQGNVDASGVSAGGVDVKTLSARATRNGAATDFDATAALVNGTNIATAGSLAEITGGYRVGLTKLDLTQGKTGAHLLQPASVEIAGKQIRIARAIDMDVAGGHIQASGTAGDTYDLAVTIQKLPLSIANTVKPDLAAAGTIDGTAKVTGPRAKPIVDFKVDAKGITAKPIEAMGLPAFDLDATGRTAGDAVAIDAGLSATNGIKVTAKGKVPTGAGRMDLAVDIARFPLATLDRLAKGQNPQGTVTGSAHVTGTLKDPAVDFKANGSGLSAAPLTKFGVSPLSLDVAGNFRSKTVTLSDLKVSNGQGISVTGSGRLPLLGEGLSFKARGRAPLSLADRPLADRGTRIDGSVLFDVSASGALSKPVIGGSVSTSDMRVIDPQTNVRFNGIVIRANIANNRVSIAQFRAPLATGGVITAGGSVSIDPASGFPADLTINLDKTRYTDGDFITATASGRLTVTGKLLADPTIGGRIDVERADIGIPENLGGAAKLTNIRHVHTPANVAATLKRARLDTVKPGVPTERPSVAHLDLTVNAPRRLFIRGRGLDAEMGGKIHLGGTVGGISAVGGFELIRGRLEILGKRLDFQSGEITLTGSFDPMINLVATSDAGDVTVTITVSGRASDPNIVFSSQPSLPQDEVLAQLIFGRSISDLSGFQIAQLAAAVAELSGGSNNSILGNLRNATGLDDLDVTTDSKGNASVRAGRYIADNVYLGVEAGAHGDEKVDLNLDITKHLKAKVSAGAGGDSSGGIFYEKDY